MTSDIQKRVWEHKNKVIKGFSYKYNLDKLVYVEHSDDIETAIHREKRLKKYTREAKINLIEQNNPNWNDLWVEINGAYEHAV